MGDKNKIRQHNAAKADEKKPEREAHSGSKMHPAGDNDKTKAA
jgi:hypothetical protein